MKYFFLFLMLAPSFLRAQKQVYIPNEWQQGSLDYSFDRSAQSDNFVVFWGPLAGSNPTQAPADIAFNAQQILDTAEELYKFYIDTIQFVRDDDNLLSEYKIILVMLHTWTGLEGWAFGGNYDGVVGAMWMHPHAASSGPTLAHEFTHTMQNYAWMLNPGHGFIDSSYVGFFWETHAEFMALQRYPSVALEFDMARWLNTNHFHWSSTRHHYQAFVFLQFIKERDGITMINRMWNESIIGEHPLQTYMRLKGIDQQALNDLFGEYAMRNVTWDYEIGDLLRQRVSTLPEVFVSHPTIIPGIIDTSLQWYRIQNHLAPQDYGYNIIKLYPEDMEECGSRYIYLNFQSQKLIPGQNQGGLSYGFVAIDDNQQPRYSELYDQDMEVAFELMYNEDEVYLVVVGAPTIHHNYAWEIGFPKIYRYPYEFRVDGAIPEGYQPGFHSIPEGVSGALHVNGGGFVASTAYAAPTAYVGPNAQVLDVAQVKGNARIEDFAIIKHSAIVEGNSIISDMAIIGENAHVYENASVAGQAHVYGGNQVYGSAVINGNTLIFESRVYDNATLTDNTFAWGANLHGDVYIGGDAEFFRECDNGTYLQFEGAYGRNCDGLDDHHANVDVTTAFVPATKESFYSVTCDGLVEYIEITLFEFICEGDTFNFYGDLLTDQGLYQDTFENPEGADTIVTLWLYFHISPIFVGNFTLCEGDTVIVFGIPYTMEGVYPIEVIDSNGCLLTGGLTIDFYVVDTSVNRQDNRLVALATASTFQWYDCSTGLPIPGANQRTFTPSENGSYMVEVTDINGCTGFSTCYEMLTVSTEDFNKITVDFSPNPVSDYLQIQLGLPAPDIIQLEILDLLGEKLMSYEIKVNENLVKMDLSHLPGGFYIVRLHDSKGHHAVRAISKI